MKVEDLLDFDSSLVMKYGKSPLMEITITREAGISLISELGPRASMYSLYLDENERVTWDEFQIQSYRGAIKIKNGGDHGPL